MGLATCLGLLWFFLRWRRSKQHQGYPREEQTPRADGSVHKGVDTKGELEAKEKLPELHGRRDGTEAPEMEASSIPPETGPFEISDQT